MAGTRAPQATASSTPRMDSTPTPQPSAIPMPQIMADAHAAPKPDAPSITAADAAVDAPTSFTAANRSAVAPLPTPLPMTPQLALSTATAYGRCPRRSQAQDRGPTATRPCSMGKHVGGTRRATCSTADRCCPSRVHVHQRRRSGPPAEDPSARRRLVRADSRVGASY